MYWVTLEDNDIETVSDLEGKNVGVFEQGAAFNNLTILSVLGMLDDVNTRYVPFNSIASALDEGRIDATGIYASQGRTPAGWQTQIINNENVQMVTYSEDQIDQIGSSGYATPAPVYVDDIYSKDLSMDTITGMAIPYGFFTRPEISQDRMYEFTSTLLNNVDQVQQFAESVSHFDAEYAAQSVSPGIPVHSGVAQYLKENDLWRDELSEA
jgi:TRAP transporter TAXI family solute receptor